MSNENTTTRPHHPYGPSKLQDLEACPKYAGMSGDSEASRMGTMQHDVADSGIDDPRLPDYKAMAAVECLKFAESRAAEYPGGTIIKEQYLPIDDERIVVDGREWVGTTAGYLDFAVVSADGTKAEIIDYKFGKHAVEEAKNNLQGIAYLLGLLRCHKNLQTVQVWFLLPHRDEFTSHTFTRNGDGETHGFDALTLRVKCVVHRALEANKKPDDFSMATPYIPACLFCANLGKCPKVAATMLSVGRKYSPAALPDDMTPSLILDPAQAALGIKLASLVKVWAEAYRKQATEKSVGDPTFVPDGYKLVSKSKRRILLPRKFGELAKSFLPPEQQEKIEELYDIQLGPVEKLISTSAPRGFKEKTVDAFNEAALGAGLVEEGQPFVFLQMDEPKGE